MEGLELSDADTILRKIKALPGDKQAEVEDFVDFILSRIDGPASARDTAALSQKSFERVWSNPDDAAYDAL
jgi:hypothetical protein